MIINRTLVIKFFPGPGSGRRIHACVSDSALFWHFRPKHFVYLQTEPGHYPVSCEGNVTDAAAPHPQGTGGRHRRKGGRRR